jgi:phosphopantothenoylcysteine decarboxylase/phosphopantothenate--cysteine ligase
MLRDKNILIGVSGSIAAYKIPVLVRLLRKAGANVQIIMTPSAKDFVTPLTLSTVSNRPVLTQVFKPETGEWNSHVELALWADLLLLAPLSANTLAKMAHGIADNLLLTTYLSARTEVMFAPAMDLDMYKHPSTKKNIQTLLDRKHILIEPTEGELASGLCGAGRMEEPENIFRKIKQYFEQFSKLTGKKVMVSAGPTFESIDPVRFIGNHSSGKMGFAIAKELANRGAEVSLIAGPVSLATPVGITNRRNVVSAADMLEVCNECFPKMDIGIMAAAVADFTPQTKEIQKIKKGNVAPVLKLTATKDILLALGNQKQSHQLLVGFALETENEVENALKKLHHKNLDLIVLNSLQDNGAGFGHDTNMITMIDRSEHPQSFGLKSKEEVAKDIVDKIESLML